MSQWIYIALFFIVGLIIPVGAIDVHLLALTIQRSASLRLALTVSNLVTPERPP